MGLGWGVSVVGVGSHGHGWGPMGLGGVPWAWVGCRSSFAPLILAKLVELMAGQVQPHLAPLGMLGQVAQRRRRHELERHELVRLDAHPRNDRPRCACHIRKVASDA